MSRELQVDAGTGCLVESEGLVIEQDTRQGVVGTGQKFFKAFPLPAGETRLVAVFPADEPGRSGQFDGSIPEHTDTMCFQVTDRIIRAPDILMVTGDAPDAERGFQFQQRGSQVVPDHGDKIFVHDIAGQQDDIGLHAVQQLHQVLQPAGVDQGSQVDVGSHGDAEAVSFCLSCRDADLQPAQAGIDRPAVTSKQDDACDQKRGKQQDALQLREEDQVFQAEAGQGQQQQPEQVEKHCGEEEVQHGCQPESADPGEDVAQV